MTLSFYLRPLDLGASGDLPPGARPLAGGPRRFARLAVTWRQDGHVAAREEVAPADLVAALSARDPGRAAAGRRRLEALSAPRPPFAGLGLDQPRIMAVINVTPDSFSDGGDRFDPGRAAADGLALAEAGAAILDVGGESTRPGAEAVPEAEELRRTIPVVKALADQGLAVSIDTRRARVMAEALAAGARIVNDVTALAGEPESLEVVARSDASIVLMHMQGEPRTMQRDPHYEDAALDIHDFLAGRIAACAAAGIDRSRLALDPGIGFGKTLAHNLEILDQMALYHDLGCPLVLGVSRKSFIAKLSRGEAPKERLAGSLAAALAGLARGVQILRVHDVGETRQAVAVWRAIEGAAPGPGT
ncbi:MAG: dihydropteroate synthase [Kiloniellales bacterium]|nr:dihydropteroate synthase [Kiloniellales bacterium]